MCKGRSTATYILPNCQNCADVKSLKLNFALQPVSFQEPVFPGRKLDEDSNRTRIFDTFPGGNWWTCEIL